MSFIVGERIGAPRASSLVAGSVTGSVAYAYGHATSFERRVLQAMMPMLRDLHKYVEVKIRCRFATQGEPFMTMAKPHYDVTMDLSRAERPEVHHLFCTPPSPIFYTVSPDMKPIRVDTPEGCIITYGRHALHQTPVIGTDQMRLLVRVTESDIVRPRNVSEGR